MTPSSVPIACLLVIGGALTMALAIHLWTEWEMILLRGAGATTQEMLLSAVFTHGMAAMAYWVGFVLLMTGAWGIAGRTGVYLVWGLLGFVFELAQFLLVKIRTVGADGISPREWGLLLLATGLMALLGLVVRALCQGAE